MTAPRRFDEAQELLELSAIASSIGTTLAGFADAPELFDDRARFELIDWTKALAIRVRAVRI